MSEIGSRHFVHILPSERKCKTAISWLARLENGLSSEDSVQDSVQGLEPKWQSALSVAFSLAKLVLHFRCLFFKGGNILKIIKVC